MHEEITDLGLSYPARPARRTHCRSLGELCHPDESSSARQLPINALTGEWSTRKLDVR
jgi:hypothetical protein